jgi:hypothetical protein
MIKSFERLSETLIKMCVIALKWNAVYFSSKTFSSLSDDDVSCDVSD